MSRTAVQILLDASERELLQKIHRKRSVPEFMKQRLHIVLSAATGIPNKKIAEECALSVVLVMLIAVLCDIPLTD